MQRILFCMSMVLLLGPVSPQTSAEGATYKETAYVLRDGTTDPALADAAATYCSGAAPAGYGARGFQLYTIKLDRDAGTVRDFLHKNVGHAFVCFGDWTPPYGPQPVNMQYSLDNGDVFEFQGRVFAWGFVGPPSPVEPGGLNPSIIVTSAFATSAPERFRSDDGFFNVALARHSVGSGPPLPVLEELHHRGIAVIRAFELVED